MVTFLVHGQKNIISLIREYPEKLAISSTNKLIED